jgi:SAM-dependent methyltransferase
MPDPRLIATAYAGAASFDYVAEEQGQRATAARWLERLEAHAGAPRRLLDLGCWVGYLLVEAERRGWHATGVEPSAFAATFARDRLGLDVIEGDLFSHELTGQTFDVVTMNDVIEHLAEPGEALDRAAELLAGGGIVGLLIPDAGSAIARMLGRRWWSVIPTHLQYFTRRSIGVLLRRHGFDVVEIATAPKAFTVRYYLDRLSGYSESGGRAAVAAASRLGVADRLWAPDFRDRMAVIARRR